MKDYFNKWVALVAILITFGIPALAPNYPLIELVALGNAVLFYLLVMPFANFGWKVVTGVDRSCYITMKHPTKNKTTKARLGFSARVLFNGFSIPANDGLFRLSFRMFILGLFTLKAFTVYYAFKYNEKRLQHLIDEGWKPID
jgi:hypothetical protein